MGSPPHVPHTDFPGAEYFALAPNRNIALGPRLSLTVASAGPVTVPAAGAAQNNANGPIIPTFTPTTGLYIVRAYALYIPSDTSGQLQIIGARLALFSGATGPTSPVVDVGTPLATFSNPIINQIAISETQALVTGIDFGPILPLQAPLSALWQVVVRNPDTVVHSFDVQGRIVFHRIDGFVQ